MKYILDNLTDIFKFVWHIIGACAAGIIFYLTIFFFTADKPIVKYYLGTDENNNPAIRADVQNWADYKLPIYGINYADAYALVDSLNDELIKHPRIKN